MTRSLEKPFIHFHIPKTAGTSLRATFINGLGADKVAFLMYERNVVRASELPFDTEELDKARRQARETGQLSQFSARIDAMNRGKVYDAFPLSEIGKKGIELATGHFVPTDITEVISGVTRTTVLREPLERAWSHYFHWKEAKGSMWWHDGDVSFSDDVTFERFVTDPKLMNYHARYLGDLGYAAIGVTNNIPAFLEEIGLEPDLRVPSLNSGRYKEMPTFDSGFLRDFKEMNAVDYEMYEEARRLG
jgi:hypothetical protein